MDATTNQPIELATLWIAGQLDRLAWPGDGGEFTLTARADRRKPLRVELRQKRPSQAPD